MFSEGRGVGSKARGRRGRSCNLRVSGNRPQCVVADKRDAEQDVNKGDELTLRNDVPRGSLEGKSRKGRRPSVEGHGFRHVVASWVGLQNFLYFFPFLLRY